MGAELERLWKTPGTCRVKRLGASPTSLMVGKYAQGESASQRSSRRSSEPNAAAAADPRRLRALPPGSPGDAGLAEDAGVLRRHGPALPEVGGGRRGAAVRGAGCLSAARLPRPAGDEARAAWPTPAA